jgi:Cu-Zn family superoxide dismutase
MRLNGALHSTALVLTLSALTGCGGDAGRQQAMPESAAGVSGRTATATLQSTSGSGVAGTVTFTQQDDGVLVFAMVSGLSPGPHGFHIHEHGDCTAPDGSSAGAHFDPTGMPHGGPDDMEQHVGDLGNIVAGESGTANYERVLPFLTLEDGPTSIVGRSVVIHQDPDDLVSQPAGNAGPRIACGVIVAANR